MNKHLAKRKAKKAKMLSRKERKKNRKQKAKQTPSWLTPELDKQLKRLSRQMTKEAVDWQKSQPLHVRFKCANCNRVYCLNNDGKVIYCGECYLGKNWVNCAKDVKDLRDCGCN